MNNVRVYILIPILMWTIQLSAQSLRLATYNIKCKSTSDTASLSWDERYPYVLQTMRDYQMDVIAIQELRVGGWLDMLSDIQCELPEYNIIYWGTESDTTIAGLCNGILYRKDRFQLLDSGHYFLSEDPAHSLCSWDTYLPRVTVWAHLLDKVTNKDFYYFSTHLDVFGKEAKVQGARVNIEQMHVIAGDRPMFLAGDYNSKETLSRVHDQFLKAGLYDSRKLALKDYSATIIRTLVPRWGPKDKSNSRLDYIYTNIQTIQTYQIVTDYYGRMFPPSDHFPVVIETTL